MKRICIYCHKEIEFKKGQQFGAHLRNCTSRPDIKKLNEQIKIKKTIERKTYKFKCPKCGKFFKLFLSIKEYKNKKRKKFCSVACANSHFISERTREKIRDSYLTSLREGKVLGKSIRNKPPKVLKIREIKYCSVCQKKIIP